MASNAPKTMSSRLMTMKFMQRSAAKIASATPSEPSTPNGPPSKRLRLSNGRSAPSTPRTPSDQEILQTALAAEERKREEALAKAAAQSGETKWVLSVQETGRGTGSGDQGLRVVHAGFALIDQDDSLESGEEEEEEERPARMQFGGGVKGKKVEKAKHQYGDDSSSSSDSEDASEEEDSEYDSDDPTAELIRETKREAAAKAREEKKEAKRRERQRAQAAKETPRRPNRIDEDRDLGGLTSLSGGRPGGLSSGGRKGASNITCFGCGEKGHTKKDCPKAQRWAAGGRPRGATSSRF